MTFREAKLNEIRKRCECGVACLGVEVDFQSLTGPVETAVLRRRQCVSYRSWRLSLLLDARPARQVHV